jgi:pSer/pThr/pTyr-binding forkhead associated (FHA) protein
MWVLKSEGEDPGLTFRITNGSTRTIGRAPRADFIVDATLVSRLHCRLAAGATELEVVDLDSTNGTYVNGRRVERASLRSGDMLGVGEVKFRISRGVPESSPESPTN